MNTLTFASIFTCITVVLLASYQDQMIGKKLEDGTYSEKKTKRIMIAGGLSMLTTTILLISYYLK